MSEYLYVEPRKRGEQPFYVRELRADEHHPRVDGHRAAFVTCNASGQDLGVCMSAEKLRHEGKRISRALLHERNVLVPV